MDAVETAVGSVQSAAYVDNFSISICSLSTAFDHFFGAIGSVILVPHRLAKDLTVSRWHSRCALKHKKNDFGMILKLPNTIGGYLSRKNKREKVSPRSKER